MNEFTYCPFCGTALDPGEKCDCQEEQNAEETRRADKALEDK